MIKHNTLAIVIVLVVAVIIVMTAIPDIMTPIYVALPIIMAAIAVMMFGAGYYYGTVRAGHSSTITTTSTPNRSAESGRYEQGRHIEQTRTEKATKEADAVEPAHSSSETTTVSSPYKSHESGKHVEHTRTVTSSN